MIRAIALDDEPPALRVLSHFCQEVAFVDLQQTFTRTDEAKQFIIDAGTDLLFLDINMPFISGTDFYRSISAEGKQPPMVIFTTAYAEYAVEGFALNAVDYLLKPFTFERFLQAVTKANDYFDWQQRTRSGETRSGETRSGGTQPSDTQPADDYLYVRADYTVYKVAFADILYIEGLDDYLKIHLVPGVNQDTTRPIVARMTMKAILDKLPDSQFIRAHRSFIVPLGRIDGIRNKTIQLAGRGRDATPIPIGASYEAAVLSRFRP